MDQLVWGIELKMSPDELKAVGEKSPALRGRLMMTCPYQAYVPFPQGERSHLFLFDTATAVLLRFNGYTPIEGRLLVFPGGFTPERYLDFEAVQKRKVTA